MLDHIAATGPPAAAMAMAINGMARSSKGLGVKAMAVVAAVIAAGTSNAETAAALSPSAVMVEPIIAHLPEAERYEAAMSICLPWVRASDAVVRLPGVSSGTAREVAVAFRAGIPVFPYLWPTKLQTLIAWAQRRVVSA